MEYPTYKTKYTVESRYLVLGYIEFCKTRSVYLNQKYILIAYLSLFGVGDFFYKSKLPEVQINLPFGVIWTCKKIVPTTSKYRELTVCRIYMYDNRY